MKTILYIKKTYLLHIRRITCRNSTVLEEIEPWGQNKYFERICRITPDFINKGFILELEFVYP